VRVLFTIRSLAASPTIDTGSISAIGFSQLGKKLIGKSAVLENITGKARKLTNLNKLSVLLREMAIPVNRVEDTTCR